MDSLTYFSDFLWKLLVVVSICSGIVFAAFLLVQPLLKKVSGRLFNRVSQISVVGVLASVAFGSLLLLFVDQDIQEKCFGSFVQSRGSFEITRIAAAIWLTGVLGLLIKDVIQYRGFKKLLLQNSLHQESDYLIVTDEMSAATVGILKSQVIIPLGLLQNSKVLGHVLSHEQTHSKNRDGLWSFAGLLVLRLCWFNPLAMFFERKRVLAMEMATDEDVIQSQKFDPSEYTQSLLTVLESNISRASSRYAPGATAGYEMLKARIENLHLQESSGKRRWFEVSTLVVMLFAWAFGMGQAFASINLQAVDPSEPMMCYQVQHEKMIEAWLQVEPPKNKCE